MTAVVLAAGASRRLGRPKQMVQLHGRSLLRHTATCAGQAGCRSVVVVLGAVPEAAAELSGLDTRVVSNPGWQRGMSGSVRVGVTAAARDPDCGAVLLLVCDQPALSAGLLRRILRRHDGVRRIAAGYGGTVGVPALFPRPWFDELCSLAGDRGAQPLLLRDPDTVVVVDWPDGAHDVDYGSTQ